MNQDSRRLVFQPRTYRAFQRGINQIVKAVSPTLGPLSRTVAVQPPVSSRAVELLDDGGAIARRIVQIADRDADIGAMFVRHMLWRLRQQIGDGTATAAVIFGSIFNQGVHYLTGGGNAMRLRHYLEREVQTVLDELGEMSVRVADASRLARIAATHTGDTQLAEIIGKVMHDVGPFAQVDVRAGRSREPKREYVQGSYWEEGLLSPSFILDHDRGNVTLTDAAVLITDLNLQEPRQLMPALDVALAAGRSALLIVADAISDAGVGLLRAAFHGPAELRAVAVKTPGADVGTQKAAMEDLAALTGGRVVTRAAGDRLSAVSAADLGSARRLWANRQQFGVIGGKGDPRRLREHLRQLRAALEGAAQVATATALEQRIARLMGGSATIYVGGSTRPEVEWRKESVERAIRVLRGALLDGAVPGGGVAFLECLPTLERRVESVTDPDEGAALRILMMAMEAPTRTLVTNAGYEAGEVMTQIRRAGPGFGFDVTCGNVVHLYEAGIMDVAAVQKAALRQAVTSAALALTVDVLVHHKKPEQVVEP